MWKPRDQQRERNERLRGWIINFLYCAKPSPIELPVLMRLLDARNYPTSRRRLAEEVDFLRSEKLLRVFPATATQEFDDLQQAKLRQRYAQRDDDGEMGDVVCARITTAGIKFQEGRIEQDGIMRVE